MRKTYCTLKFRVWLSLLAATAFSTSLSAGTVTATGYDLDHNGYTGTFYYEDTQYTNCPAASCTTQDVALSGGTGKLLDGVAPALPFNFYPTFSDPNANPYDGWSYIFHNPTITFHFTGSPSIAQVSLYLDNELTDGTGVLLPASATINGTTYAIAADNSTSGPRWVNIDIPIVSANSLAITLTHQGTFGNTMLGEVKFDSSPSSVTSAPEPSAFGMLSAGLGLGLAWLRRRRH